MKPLALLALAATFAVAQTPIPNPGPTTYGATSLMLFQIEPPPIIVQQFGADSSPVTIGCLSSTEPTTTSWNVTVRYAPPGGPSVTTSLTVQRAPRLWSNFGLPVDISWITSITVQEVSSTAAFGVLP